MSPALRDDLLALAVVLVLIAALLALGPRPGPHREYRGQWPEAAPERLR